MIADVDDLTADDPHPAAEAAVWGGLALFGIAASATMLARPRGWSVPGGRSSATSRRGTSSDCPDVNHDCHAYRVKRPWRCDCGARLRVCSLCRADLSKHKGKCAQLYPIWPDWRPPT